MSVTHSGTQIEFVFICFLFYSLIILHLRRQNMCILGGKGGGGGEEYIQIFKVYCFPKKKPFDN